MLAVTSVLAVASVLAVGGCKARAQSEPRKPVEESHAGIAPDAAPKPRASKPGSDVTFLVVSDTHFGYGGMVEQNRALVSEVNGIEGHAYPSSVGGKVGHPRGLLVTGDLTEWGRTDEWEPFVATYGLDGGSDGLLRMPVFEVVGNHDKVHGPWVEGMVVARHGGRFYSWDWDDLHLVALGEAPDDEGLAFLAKDLATIAPNVPVVLYFHLALEGPWSTGNWFDAKYKDRLLATIAGHDILAIFHGHHHATDHYVWHGIDVFKPGAVKNDAHTFAVAHLTDQRFTVDSYDWNAHVWREMFAKERRH